MSSTDQIFDAAAPEIYHIQTQAPGPAGSLPITEEMLLNRPSGDLFGLSLNVGMGWNPAEAGRKQFLILSTQGGLRAPDGKPVALGYHTGHWEIGRILTLLPGSGARRLQECARPRAQQRGKHGVAVIFLRTQKIPGLLRPGTAALRQQQCQDAPREIFRD